MGSKGWRAKGEGEKAVPLTYLMHSLVEDLVGNEDPNEEKTLSTKSKYLWKTSTTGKLSNLQSQERSPAWIVEALEARPERSVNAEFAMAGGSECSFVK